MATARADAPRVSASHPSRSQCAHCGLSGVGALSQCGSPREDRRSDRQGAEWVPDAQSLLDRREPCARALQSLVGGARAHTVESIARQGSRTTTGRRCVLGIRHATALTWLPPRTLSDAMHVIDRYARSIVSRKLPAGTYHRLACERHVRDLL